MRFKKRRRPGPSKNQKKVQRRQVEQREARGGSLLKELHPEVTGLTIHLSYMSPQAELVSEETRRFGPADSTDFSCACPGTCGVGAFDLREKIGAVIETRESMSESSGKCETERFGGIEPCGYVLKCKIEVQY